jgi:hypothetical protein
VTKAEIDDDSYRLTIGDKRIQTPVVINAAYANINQVAALFGQSYFPLKYELCEVILCKVSPGFSGMGITVMDGPFVSLMPFGDGSIHSLTSVSFTPHQTANQKYPVFACQALVPGCSRQHLQNCNLCNNKPVSAWNYMRQLANKYLVDTGIEYRQSLFAVKPILTSAETDDSRPTVIKDNRQSPRFISVLSGKINTMYDMDEVLGSI